MSYDTAPSGSSAPRPPAHPERTGHLVMTGQELRTHGVSAAELAANCRPGGPWQQLLPQVYLLQAGPVGGMQRLLAALRYAGAMPHGRQRGVPKAVVTGFAALALHGFRAVPRLEDIEHIEILAAAGGPAGTTGFVHIRHPDRPPQSRWVSGVPCAPVPRALADAVADLTDAGLVRALLTESVRTANCDPVAVVQELRCAGLLSHPHLVHAVDALLAAGRTAAEQRLYEMVRRFDLPDPLWNVDLRLPGGPYLDSVDAYWPEHAVALELDARSARHDDAVRWQQCAHGRERLADQGVEVISTTPRRLRMSLVREATVVRTALLSADDRAPHPCLTVLPR